MPIVASSSSTGQRTESHPGALAQASRAVTDLTYLLSFRLAPLRRRSGVRWAVAALLLTTVAIGGVPAYLPGAGAEDGRALNFLLLLPTAFVAFLALTTFGAAAAGGGRELIARDPATVHPISPTTDHLGALLLAPLNIGWLIQAWGLMATTAYAVGDRQNPLIAQTVVVLWLAVATAIAQVIAWTVEATRRSPRGLGVVRILTVGVLGLALGLQLSGTMIAVLDQVPTRSIVIGMISDSSLSVVLTLLSLVAILICAVVIGAFPAHAAARRSARDEASVETGRFPARGAPRSARAGLVRTDRSSVWRAVPMRRGLAVLAGGPGLVAILGNLPWSSMTILPGLVASGGLLLFGVNSWCLDGRGALWRESLPVKPSLVFDARAWVLGEFLLVASAVTIMLGAVRAGMPNVTEATAIGCTLVVVTVQVVAAGMRWSAAHPHAVDLRSARATPAPPLSMVGYSVRLAVPTTLTGLVFSGLAQVPDWRLSVFMAVPFLAWSAARLLRSRAAWIDPVRRAGVVMTVAV